MSASLTPAAASGWFLSREYSSPQGTIRWEEFGEGPPIVLLHGTPNWSFIWRKIVHTLGARHRVLVFDWPGFGTSDRYAGQNISWDEQARRLPELFAEWGVVAPTVVAFDFAPVFALRAHLLDGLDIGALVLADAAVIPPFVTDFSRVARDNIGVLRQLPVHIAEAMIAAHLRQTTYHPLSPEVLQSYLAPWLGAEGTSAYWRAVAAYDENLARPLVERLHRLTVPTRLLWGEHDKWFPAPTAVALAEAIPGAELHFIPDAGHFAPEDNPAAFGEAVLTFTQEVESGAPQG